MKSVNLSLIALVPKGTSLLAALVFGLSACGSSVYVSQAPSCTVAANGQGSVITCPDGSTTQVMNGVNGADGSSVTPVKFCAASSEYGFCIANKLYAVYYTGNAVYLAELASGQTYQTTTNGPNCSFTVGSNCEVN